MATTPPSEDHLFHQVLQTLNEAYAHLREFYWVLLGFTGFYWVLLGFTGFYWVLLGFTGFYWVLLGVDAGISVVSNVFFVAGTATSSHSALLATGSGVTSEFSFRPIIRILPSSFFFIHCLLFFFLLSERDLFEELTR